MRTRPAAVAFDVDQTLFDLVPLGERFAAAGLPVPDALLRWFSSTLRDGFALAAAGGYAPFKQLAAAHLRTLLTTHDADPGQADEILAAFTELPAQSDAEPALRRLSEAGVPAVTLTNGSAEITEQLLQRAGLRDRVQHVLSVDAVRAWKPRPEPYHHAAQVLGSNPPGWPSWRCTRGTCSAQSRRGSSRGTPVARRGASFPVSMPRTSQRSVSTR